MESSAIKRNELPINTTAWNVMPSDKNLMENDRLYGSICMNRGDGSVLKLDCGEGCTIV